MKIGLDLDNTLVCYDRCFHVLACRIHAMPDTVPVAKNAVRQFFRDAGREASWTALQGVAYGSGMGEAEAFGGALDFVRRAVAKGISVNIISHRTKYPIVGDKTDLHQAAMEWLTKTGFVGPGALTDSNVFFETSKEAKCERIRAEGCRLFLDDLPEILQSPLFPENVEAWLFAPGTETDLKRRIVRDWDTFRRQVL